MPKIKVHRQDILRAKEIQHMLTQADPRMRCLIGLLWGFGKRVTECLMLQREEIFVEKGYLMIRFHVLKKRKNREDYYLKSLTLRHPATQLIMEYCNTIKQGPLFPKLSRQLALYYLKKTNKDSYLHLFRKSLATEMSEHSFTVQQLMAWFDWSMPDVAMSYVQRGPGLTKELSERTW
jgi:integrase